MRPWRQWSAVIAMLVGLSAAEAKDPAVAPALTGKWTIVAREFQGKSQAIRPGEQTLEFQGDQVTFAFGANQPPLTLTCQVTGTSRGGQIEMVDAEKKRSYFNGFFSLEEKTLRLSVTTMGAARPREWNDPSAVRITLTKAAP